MQTSLFLGNTVQSPPPNRVSRIKSQPNTSRVSLGISTWISQLPGRKSVTRWLVFLQVSEKISCSSWSKWNLNAILLSLLEQIGLFATSYKVHPAIRHPRLTSWLTIYVFRNFIDSYHAVTSKHLTFKSLISPNGLRVAYFLPKLNYQFSRQADTAPVSIVFRNPVHVHLSGCLLEQNRNISGRKNDWKYVPVAFSVADFVQLRKCRSWQESRCQSSWDLSFIQFIRLNEHVWVGYLQSCQLLVMLISCGYLLNF